jgi:carbon starvation protein
MNLLVVVLPVAVILTVAYFTYGRVLSRLLRLDPNRATPAVELRDDVDYSPIEPKFLLSQHFSAIAAAGPIVGPILAGIMFGWAPALAWIVVGSIFIGGVHDMTALVASIRHKARSIAEVVRDHMTQRSYVLFLSFVWLALVYIIVAFTDITAASFVGVQTLENGQQVTGGGTATSSLLYLALPIVMGLLLRYTKLSLNLATIIFVPLIGVAIWVGQKIPFDVAAILDISNQQAHKVWDVALILYCLVAAVVPMWLLLQPRGHLGGYFLYIALAAAALGLVFGGKTIQYPAFTGWTTPAGDTLFPMLFITIACGACSGFHSLIASGTTSKQLKRETDARPIGYGAMLLEGMVATISLCCVMMLAANSPAVTGTPRPSFIYASGIGGMLEPLGIASTLAVSFALMAFTTFVYDTLDVCTRLGRYIIQELLGMHNMAGKWIGTLATAGVPLFFLLLPTANDAAGKPIPVWRTFWALFGASNQLLAALTLLGVTVWLWRTRRAAWVWLVTGVPTVLMYVMSTWALLKLIQANLGASRAWYADTVTWVAIVLVALAALMLIEAARVLFSLRTPRPPQGRAVPAGA